MGAWWGAVLVLGWTLCYGAVDTASVATEQYGSGEEGVLALYQRYLSPAKGGNTCTMTPSCSQYARMAVERYGPVRAFLLASDRMVRCGHDRSQYPKRFGLLHDPLEADTAVVRMDVLRRVLLADTLEWQGEELSEADASYVSHLLLRGQYWKAAEIFERLGTVAHSKEQKRHAVFNAARCYLLGQHYEAFLDLWRFWLKEESLFPPRDDGPDLMLSKGYYLRGDYRHSLLFVHAISDSASPAVVEEKKFMQMLNHARLGEWMEACSSASYIPVSSGRYAIARNIGQLNDRKNVLEKSPGLAASLSMVPGMGYFYLGKKGTALASLLINGLFAWTTVEAIQSRHYAIATTASFLGVGWYFGNIWGSYRSAYQHNQNIYRELVDSSIVFPHFR